MTTREINVDLLTSSYRIMGHVHIVHIGLMGLLSDESNYALELHDASMARLHMATKMVEKAPLVRVVKNQIVAACLDKREDSGIMPIMRHGYSHVYKYPIRLTTNIYELEGTMEWAGRFDFSIIMVDGKCDFIPLYDASLGAILFPNLLIQAPVVLFNRRFLNSLVVMNESLA